MDQVGRFRHAVPRDVPARIEGSGGDVTAAVAEVKPWYRRPHGPYYGRDVVTAERLGREHVMDRAHPLSCAGRHTHASYWPCPPLQWATRVSLAQRRGQLAEDGLAENGEVVV